MPKPMTGDDFSDRLGSESQARAACLTPLPARTQGRDTDPQRVFSVWFGLVSGYMSMVVWGWRVA